jgi:hypothetical protein
VLLCDKDHPQDVAFDRSTYNRASPAQRDCAARSLATIHAAQTLRLADLVSAVLGNPDTKAAYFDRLKQLLGQYNNNTRSWLEDEVWKMKELIAADARADVAIWKTSNDWDSAVQALVEQIKQRRKQLYEQVYAQK